MKGKEEDETRRATDGGEFDEETAHRISVMLFRGFAREKVEGEVCKIGGRHSDGYTRAEGCESVSALTRGG